MAEALSPDSAAVPTDWLAAFVGSDVVVDTDAGYLAIGRLSAIGVHHLTLDQCDLHDHHEANSTKEVYVMESQRLGVRANRGTVTLPRQRMVAISRVADVLG